MIHNRKLEKMKAFFSLPSLLFSILLPTSFCLREQENSLLSQQSKLEVVSKPPTMEMALFRHFFPLELLSNLLIKKEHGKNDDPNAHKRKGRANESYD